MRAYHSTGNILSLSAPRGATSREITYFNFPRRARTLAFELAQTICVPMQWNYAFSDRIVGTKVLKNKC